MALTRFSILSSILTLYLVHPGTAGRREVKVKPLPLGRLQPPFHLGAFVTAGVVHDEMNLLVGGKLLFEQAEKLEELLAAMTRKAGADDLAV